MGLTEKEKANAYLAMGHLRVAYNTLEIALNRAIELMPSKDIALMDIKEQTLNHKPDFADWQREIERTQ